MQYNLFEEESESITDTLVRLSIPDFIPLAVLMEKRGMLPVFLEAAYAILSQHNYDQALLMLREYSRDHCGSGFLYLSDLKGDPSCRSQVSSLKEALSRHTARNGVTNELGDRRPRAIQNIGSQTHRDVRYIFTQSFEPSFYQPQAYVIPALFPEDDQTVLQLDRQIELLSAHAYPYAIARDGRVSKSHLLLMENHWRPMAKALRENESWHSQFMAIRPAIPELRLLLFAVLGDRVLPPHFKGKPDAALAYLDALRLMTLTTTLFWAAKQPVRPIFGEIPPLHKRHGLSGGFIDRVTAIPTNRFSRASIAKLTRASHQAQLPSVGCAHGLISSLTRADFMLRLGDYKCAVGDSPSGFSVLRSRDVLKPFSKHVRQISDYLALGHVDICLTYGIKDLWDTSTESMFNQGDLVYLFPDQSEPTIFSLSLDLERKMECFKGIISQLDTARARADHRETIAAIASRLKQRLAGARPAGKKGSRLHDVPLFDSQPHKLAQLTLAAV